MQYWTRRLLARSGDRVYLLSALLLLWYALSGGRHWVVGVVAVLAAGVFGSTLTATPKVRVSLVGLLRFMLYFIHRSIEGGIDVAWRALHPRMPLVPQEEWRPLLLPPGPGRALFIATTSLLPGTLACNYADGRIRVHSISANPGAKLDELEIRVRAMFAPGQGVGVES